MPIRVKCACGKQFGAPEKYAGKKVKCPECSQVVVIPQANAQAGNVVASTPINIAVKCACGQAVSVKAALAGKTVQCPGCKKPLKIPLVKQTSQQATDASLAGSTSSASSSSVEALFDEVGIGPIPGAGDRGAASARRCPECKAPMADEAIICIQCGYNERLGRKMETFRPRTEQDRKKKAAK